MDLLKQELQRKRKAVELAKKSSDVGRIKNTSGTGAGAGSNDGKSVQRAYLKAADLRRFQDRQEEEREKEEKRLKRSAASKSGSINRNNHKKLKCSDDDNNNNNSNNNNKNNKNNNDSMSKRKGIQESSRTKERQELKKVNQNIKELESRQDEKKDNTFGEKMSSLEITTALREYGIPVWLFGERSDTQRLERLREARDSRKAAMMGLSEMDEYKLGSGHGIRNTFLGKSKDDGLDLQSKNNKEEVLEKLEEDSHQMKENSDDPHKAIHGFFKMLLRQWEEDLANRPDSIKRTAAGKNETKTLKQCRDYIRPLFKLCKNRTLEENIMGSILKIVNFCKEGEFVRANDVYMDVAIGRAAWPIGVTMVGIHQRTGRERINADKVAHVMNSELQRKYLTSVKRLITYSQKKRPDVDPSKKVTNV
jgi:pre-mRNA-splicing factor 18